MGAKTVLAAAAVAAAVGAATSLAVGGRGDLPAPDARVAALQAQVAMLRDDMTRVPEHGPALDGAAGEPRLVADSGWDERIYAARQFEAAGDLQRAVDLLREVTGQYAGTRDASGAPGVAEARRELLRLEAAPPGR